MSLINIKTIQKSQYLDQQIRKSIYGDTKKVITTAYVCTYMDDNK